ncbi:hypothetical protein NIES4071_109000 (plasmid) [Calothrix sp. NIES-4071]|nr:hypothetical protein NIES4071_109000 [Calothrix sp. NIES-4071]BAZ65163.1 hypothetical protein NIES4105_108960 [Calothrix sp. NIES-4105]
MKSAAASKLLGYYPKNLKNWGSNTELTGYLFTLHKQSRLSVINSLVSLSPCSVNGFQFAVI